MPQAHIRLGILGRLLSTPNNQFRRCLRLHVSGHPNPRPPDAETVGYLSISLPYILMENGESPMKLSATHLPSPSLPILPKSSWLLARISATPKSPRVRMEPLLLHQQSRNSRWEHLYCPTRRSPTTQIYEALSCPSSRSKRRRVCSSLTTSSRANPSSCAQ